MFEEGILVCHRCIVRGAESLNKLVNILNDLYGSSEEVDTLEERFIFSPKEEAGNLNVINRETNMILLYDKNNVVVQHVVSTVPYNKPLPISGSIEVFGMRQSQASNANLRRLFRRCGFTLKSDFAKKGLRFQSRHDLEIVLTRPYNIEFNERTAYETGVPSWDNKGGAPPLGPDYLLEMRKIIINQSELQNSVDSIVDLHSKLAVLVERSS